MKYALGADLGGTNIKYMLIDNAGREIDHFENLTGANGGREVIMQNMISGLKHMLNRHRDKKIQGIGIGSPGLIDEKGKVVIGAANLKGWDGTDIHGGISREIDLPVFVDNDVTLVALGEAYFGVGKHAASVLCLALGTGLGGGIIINKKIYRGRHGYAGEFGHMTVNPHPDAFNCSCGKKGCLETYASSIGLRNLTEKHVTPRTRTALFNYVKKTEDITPVHIFQAYREKDETAGKILDEMSVYLGLGISQLLHIFDPDIIILAGGITKAGDVLLELAQRHLNSFSLKFYHDKANIRLSRFQNKCGSIGAAAFVFEEMDIAPLHE